MNKLTGFLRKLSIEHLWCLIVMVGIFIFLNTHPIRPHDFWWHIAVGREIVATGQIPTVDTFSFTMSGTPYPSYQAFWLMEVALYGVYSLGGPALIVFVHSLVIASTYAILLWLSRRISGSWRSAAFATLFAAALGLNDWNVRPQAVAFPISALFLLAIHAYRRKPQRRWLIVFPLGMMLWVNCHGTFPIGLLLIGLWLTDETWTILKARLLESKWPALRPLIAPAAALLASVVACLANPRGTGILTYVSGISANPVIQNLVPEWAAPSFGSLAGKLFLGGLLLTSAILALSPRRPTAFQLLSFLAFAVLGLKTSRGSIWFGIVMAPTLAEHLTQIGKAVKRESESARKRGNEEAKRRESEEARKRGGEQATILHSPLSILHSPFSTHQSPLTTHQSPLATQNLLNAILAGLLLMGAGLSLPWFKELWPMPAMKAGLISAETPVAATDFLLQEHPPGPVFHNMAYGSYLIWAAQPEYPVFVDSRIELYSPEIWFDYLRISAGQGDWEERLQMYGIHTLMLSRQEQPGLVQAATESPNWKRVYEDTATLLLVRESRP